MTRGFVGNGGRLVILCGLVFVVASCADPRARERADVQVLVELNRPHDATVTVRVNDSGWGSVEPRPSQLVSTSTQPPRTTTTAARTPQQQAAANAAGLAALAKGFKSWGNGGLFGTPEKLQHPDATAQAIARVLFAEPRVTVTSASSKRIVASVHYGDLGSLVIQPSRVVRTLYAGGITDHSTVWVGVCAPLDQARWQSAPDTYDRLRSCAGWVPPSNGATTGVLRMRSLSSPMTPLLAALAAATLLLGASLSLRMRRGTRWATPWMAVPAGLVIVGAVVIAAACASMSSGISDTTDLFGTSVEHGTQSLAQVGFGAAVVLALAGVAVTIFAVLRSDPA